MGYGSRCAHGHLRGHPLKRLILRDLRVAEDALKDHLRAAGRLAPVAANGTPDMPTRRRRIQVTGEPLSVQIMRERR